jgi:hypothetical protein
MAIKKTPAKAKPAKQVKKEPAGPTIRSTAIELITKPAYRNRTNLELAAEAEVLLPGRCAEVGWVRHISATRVWLKSTGQGEYPATRAKGVEKDEAPKAKAKVIKKAKSPKAPKVVAIEDA